jgi:hypothetical protein
LVFYSSSGLNKIKNITPKDRRLGYFPQKKRPSAFLMPKVSLIGYIQRQSQVAFQQPVLLTLPC